MKKIALITGVTGQDGGYLARLLLKKGYEVHGVKRPLSLRNTDRIDDIYVDPMVEESNFILHYGDMTDPLSLVTLVAKIRPDEIYNLAAQSHVAISFVEPEYTANADGLGCLRLLEAIRIAGLEGTTRFYQASTSELFGDTEIAPQNELTPMRPCSPYAIAKLYSFHLTRLYREAYGMHACNGILFNHESPYRGENFVTRKITIGLSRIFMGDKRPVYLGNLNSKRDWGHARDYVEAQWMMLQANKPDDYVVATGTQVTIRDFVSVCCANLGLEIEWSGQGLSEECIVTGASSCEFGHASVDVGQKIIGVSKDYFRPSEVSNLLGDSTKIRKELGWEPATDLTTLVQEMLSADIGRERNR